ncbi:unnamed protein product [Anisakis simplex]|uniref:DNA topoisomerase n=1 Tax=Anisakis simplex TaxID=6269 RepID=A0A0M3JUU8_ANISI|nr:unnamed protein product [Anisakis simplex]
MPVYRARFSEITGSAVWRALNNLDHIDQRMVDAVECRSELDLRIGAAFTRLQTLHLRSNFANIFREFKDIISYGSCQFPTLGFVVERYKAIQEFIVETFWKLVAKDSRSGIDVTFEWDRNRLFDRDVVQVLLDMCNEASETRVTSVKQKPKSKWRPAALDTIELEKLAVRKLHMSAKDAMAVAEKLYSKGYISYPRTETNKFPANLDLNPLVDQQTANPEWGEFAQEFASPNELVGYEWSIYELVVRHFLACLSSDAKGQETKVQIGKGGESFTATGLLVEDYGYLRVYKYEKWSDKTLPQYREGELLKECKVSMNEGHTQPPSLLNEADLIALMDKYGIGTDATHAEHIETIKARRYAALNQDKRFIPGYLGLALVDGYDRMGYAMSKPHMRADLESQLKLICLGQRNKDEVLAEQTERYRRIFEQSEVKIAMLSNAFREYLNSSQRNQQQEFNASDAVHNPLSSLTNAAINQQSARRRGNTNTNSNSRGGAVRRSRQSGGNTSRGRGTSRGASRAADTVAQQPQEALTNMSDVELLNQLSIVNTGQPVRRNRVNRDTNTNAPSTTTDANTPANTKLCFCGEPAQRLQVKKEGPNHGRWFWTCKKHRTDPAQCKFFSWDAPT